MGYPKEKRYVVKEIYLYSFTEQFKLYEVVYLCRIEVSESHVGIIDFWMEKHGKTRANQEIISSKFTMSNETSDRDLLDIYL